MAMNHRLMRPRAAAGCTHPASLLLNFDVDASDQSANQFAGTLENGAFITSAEKRFGSASLRVIGGESRVSFPDSPVFTLSGDMTIEAWLRPVAFDTTYGGNYWVSQAETLENNNNRSWGCAVSEGALLFYFTTDGGTDTIISFPASIELHQWQHVAVVVRQSYVQIYLGGQLVGSASIPLPVFDSSADLVVGSFGRYAEDGYGGLSFDGYIDGLRITRAALYCGNFTPSASAPTALATRPCQCAPFNYGTYLRSECQDADFGDVYADGLGGEYFEVTVTDGCL